MPEQAIALPLDVVNLALNHLGQKKIAALDNTTELGRKMNMQYVPARDQFLREIKPNFAKKRSLWHQVVDAEQSISGATQTNPVVITSALHGRSNGDLIAIYNVGGMKQLNGKMYKIQNVALNTFELLDLNGTQIDGTEFDAYTSGGKFGELSEAPEFGFLYRYALPTDYIIIMEVNGNEAEKIRYSVENNEFLSDEGEIQARYIYRHTDISLWDADSVMAFSYLLADLSATGITNLSELKKICNAQYEVYKQGAKTRKSQEAGKHSGPPRQPIINTFLDARNRG